MKPSDFVYWLQGYFELSESTTMSEKQVQIVKNHLNLVFTHVIDPEQVAHLPQNVQAEVSADLQNIHDGEPPAIAFSPNLVKGPVKGPFDPNVVYRC